MPYQRTVYRVDALFGVRQAGLLRVFARRLFGLAREPHVQDAKTRFHDPCQEGLGRWR